MRGPPIPRKELMFVLTSIDFAPTGIGRTTSKAREKATTVTGTLSPERLDESTDIDVVLMPITILGKAPSASTVMPCSRSAWLTRFLIGSTLTSSDATATEKAFRPRRVSASERNCPSVFAGPLEIGGEPAAVCGGLPGGVGRVPGFCGRPRG